MKKYNWILEEIKKFKKEYIFMIILILIDIRLTILAPSIMKELLDGVNDKNDIYYLVNTVFKYCIVLISSLISVAIYEMKINGISYSINLNLKIKLHKRAFRVETYKLDKFKEKYLTIIGTDVNNVNSLFTNIISKSISIAITISTSIYVILKIDKKFLVLIFISYLILISIQISYNKFYKEKSKKLYGLFDRSNGYVMEFSKYMKEYSIYNSEKYFVNKYGEIENNIKDTYLSYQNGQVGNSLAMKLISNLSIIIVLGVGGYLLMNENLTNGEITIFLLYFSRLFSPLISLLNMISSIPQIKISFERISEFFITVDEKEKTL